MSTETRAQNGGKTVAEDLVGQTKALVEQARTREQQLELVDPLSPEEMAEAQERLGPNAGNLAVLADARANKRGRPKGSRNRRTDDFARYLLSFGPHPGVTMMKIQATPPEVLVERSRLLDPPKRRLSYGDAVDRILRSAEGLLPYFESKLPAKVQLEANGDFNLIVPGVNISEAEARDLADGTFVFDAEYHDVDGEDGDDA